MIVNSSKKSNLVKHKVNLFGFLLNDDSFLT